jgi:hypothetical protein
LRHLGRWQGGGTPSKAVPEFWQGSIPWVSPKDMKASVVRDSLDHISEAATQKSAATLIPERSILVVTRSGTDRVFSLLEREFETSDVRAAVAEAIRPRPGYALDAHRTLLALATSRGGTTRLVTTNFDLLFEECEPNLRGFGPPYLPDPQSDREFRGIVHLHGRVNTGYDGPDDDEFVVSSADFGRAYISDGWATRFMRALLAHFLCSSAIPPMTHPCSISLRRSSYTRGIALGSTPSKVAIAPRHKRFGSTEAFRPFRSTAPTASRNFGERLRSGRSARAMSTSGIRCAWLRQIRGLPALPRSNAGRSLTCFRHLKVLRGRQKRPTVWTEPGYSPSILARDTQSP